MKLFLLGLLTFVFLLPAQSKEATIEAQPLTFQSFSLSKSYVAPGDNAGLSLQFSLMPRHYIYSDSLRIKVVEPKEVLIDKVKAKSEIQFYDTHTKRIRRGLKAGTNTLKTIIGIPEGVLGDSLMLSLQLTYTACTKRYCLFPQNLTIKIPIPLTKTASKPKQTSLLERFKEKNKSLWFAFITLFLAGLFTSFTPCVLPLIPVTFSVLKSSHHSPFFMSLCYVLGLSVVYSFLGLIAALTGQIFGNFLGNPWVSGALGGLFLVFGLFMLDIFPWPTPFEKFLNKPRKIKSFGGAFIGGALAGLIASPCVGPVLFTVLTYVAQTQNIFYGFLYLFVFAFGLGQPFLFLGTFSHRVKKLSYLKKYSQFFKVLLAISMMLLSLFYFKPLYSYLKSTVFLGVGENPQLFSDSLPWKPLTQESLNEALKKKKPVVMDFWASWCASCQELEAYSFTSSEVQSLKEQFIFLKFDATNSSDELDFFKRQYKILGLPFVTFYSSKGEWLEDLTLKGFESGENFSKRLKKVLSYHE